MNSERIHDVAGTARKKAPDQYFKCERNFREVGGKWRGVTTIKTQREKNPLAL